jgi:hypothetical protein
MARINEHPIYGVWQGMLRRCYTPTNRAFQDYGGRGIGVCDRWRNSFLAFAEDMGERPHGTSIDRKDNDGDYTPENCRWATKKEQQRNRRVNRRLTIEGRTYLAVELAELSGLKTDTIIHRAACGLPYEAVICPIRKTDIGGLKLGGKANGERQKAKTHCQNGHPYSEENTSVTPQGWRRCRACHAAKERARRAL